MRVVSEGTFFDYVSDRFLQSARLRISSGCGEGCLFCGEAARAGEVAVFDSRGELREELLALWERGVHHLEFLDDPFLFNAEEMIKLFQEFEAEGVGFAFSIHSPVKVLTRNQKHLIPLKKLGLRQVTLGVLNTNDDVLARYCKKFTTADQIYAIQILQALRVQLHLRYLPFEPQTTVAQLQAGYKFFEKNKMLGLAPFSDLLTNGVELEERSPMKAEYEEKGLVQPAAFTLLPYRVFDAGAEMVWQWMRFFENEFGERWNQMHGSLLELRTELARQHPNWIVVNPGQELIYITLHLRMMPYELFKALLNYAADPENTVEISEVEMRRQVEQNFYVVEEKYWSYRKTHNI